MQQATGVSVLVLTYGHRNYIGDCIRGIQAQQYPGTLEVVVADDASPDDTVAQAREAIANDSRFKLVVNEVNLGVARNFEAALRHCTQPYIAFCEGDDYWTDPDKLRAQAELLDAHPEVSMVYTNYTRVDEGGNTLTESALGEQVQEFRMEDLMFSNGPGTNNVMMRREALKLALPQAFFTVPNPDVFIFASALLHGRCAYIDKVCSAYRIHGAGIWSSRSAAEQKLIRLTTRLQVLESINSPNYAHFEIRLREELLECLSKTGISDPLLYAKYAPFLRRTERFNLRWKHAWLRWRISRRG